MFDDVGHGAHGAEMGLLADGAEDEGSREGQPENGGG